MENRSEGLFDCSYNRYCNWLIKINLINVQFFLILRIYMLAAHIIKNNRAKITKKEYDKYNDFNFEIFKKCNNITSDDSNYLNYIDIINNSNVIYSLKTLYSNYPEFDYYTYRASNLEKFNNMTEIDVVLYWLNNKSSIDTTEINKYKQKNIIIYPHLNFNLNDGGVTVQYYLASLLDKLGVKVRMYTSSFINKNNIFNNFYNNDFDINNAIVIYCEGINGNPLNAPYTVRWMLSELGKNVPYAYVNTWGKNELVYYFNSEPKIVNNPFDFFKFLTVTYINPSIKNNNLNKRSNYCYTYRKSFYHNKLNIIHPTDSFEITRSHSQEDYIKIFNTYKYFVSYDPLTFLSIIAPLCGCISIIHPIENVTKEGWLKNSALYQYFKEKGNFNIYGIAYGNSLEELEFAEKTIHIVKDQWDDIINNYQTILINNFIDDINNFDTCINTIKNNFYTSTAKY